MAAPKFAVRSVAIIGGGPCGLAAAQYLKGQGAFERIVVYEQKSEVGGVWNHSAEPTPTDHIPQESPFCPPDEPIKPNPSEGGDSKAPVFPTPMYDFMFTNIPHQLMGFSDLSFTALYDSEGVREKKEGPLTIFPRRQLVQEYLELYSKDIRSLIKFGTKVEDVTLKQSSTGAGGVYKDSWEVRVTDTSNKSSNVETFDALIVASGHYDTTFVPDIPGIREFNAAHPGVIMHSKRYRNPKQFTNKRVMVVGNSASGVDIALQINSTCRRSLYLSVRSPTPASYLNRIKECEEVLEIKEFVPEKRGVRLVDGRLIKDLDAIVFCTGFLFSLPFLEREKHYIKVANVGQAEEAEKASSGDALDSLLTDGRRIFGLYKDLFLIDHPTLAFIGLPVRVVPFPLAETQGAIVARVWANTLPLPPAAEMHQWEKDVEKERGSAFHVWPLGAEGDYINIIHKEITESETARPGKEPPQWNAERLWERQISAEARGTFEDTGRKATTLKELGYVFDGETGQEPKVPKL